MSIENNAEFFMNMAALLIGLADSALERPAMQLSGNEAMMNGKDEPTFIDYTKVLCGVDLGRNLLITIQLRKFLKWYGEKDTDEIPEYEEFVTLVNSWNQFVCINQEAECDD